MFTNGRSSPCLHSSLLPHHLPVGPKSADPGEPLPEALAKLDPLLIENVCSEVMDSGGQLGAPPVLVLRACDLRMQHTPTQWTAPGCSRSPSSLSCASEDGSLAGRILFLPCHLLTVTLCWPCRLGRHCGPADSQGPDPGGGGVAHQEPAALHSEGRPHMRPRRPVSCWAQDCCTAIQDAASDCGGIPAGAAMLAMPQRQAPRRPPWCPCAPVPGCTRPAQGHPALWAPRHRQDDAGQGHRHQHLRRLLLHLRLLPRLQVDGRGREAGKCLLGGPASTSCFGGRLARRCARAEGAGAWDGRCTRPALCASSVPLAACLHAASSHLAACNHGAYTAVSSLLHCAALPSRAPVARCVRCLRWPPMSPPLSSSLTR